MGIWRLADCLAKCLANLIDLMLRHLVLKGCNSSEDEDWFRNLTTSLSDWVTVAATDRTYLEGRLVWDARTVYFLFVAAPQC